MLLLTLEFEKSLQFWWPYGQLRNGTLNLNPVDVVKENFSTSDGAARAPGLKRVIAESGSPKNHSIIVSSPSPVIARQSCSLRKILSVIPSSLIKGNV